MIRLLRRLRCFFKGHDNVMAFEGKRMFLQCLRCNRETPGVLLDSPKISKSERFKKRLEKHG